MMSLTSACGIWCARSHALPGHSRVLDLPWATGAQVAAEGEGLWERKATLLGQRHSRKQVASRWHKIKRQATMSPLSAQPPPPKRRRRVRKVATPLDARVVAAAEADAWRGVCHVGMLHTGSWNGVCHAGGHETHADIASGEPGWVTRFKTQWQQEKRERSALLKRAKEVTPPWWAALQLSQEQDFVLGYWCKPQAITRLQRPWQAIRGATPTNHIVHAVVAEIVRAVAHGGTYGAADEHSFVIAGAFVSRLNESAEDEVSSPLLRYARIV